MANFCLQHITNNATQHMFLPCSAMIANNTQCRNTVFDITLITPLCSLHSKASHIKKQQLSTAVAGLATKQQASNNKTLVYSSHYYQKQDLNAISTNNQVSPIGRKRKPGVNPVGRPQKKTKKAIANKTMSQTNNSSPPPLSSVMKRKNSTTSLESIASNSHSSSTNTSLASVNLNNNGNGNNTLAPPALAPLSNHNSNQLQQHLSMTPFLSFNSTIISKNSMQDAMDNNLQQTNSISSQFSLQQQQSNNNILNSNLLNCNSNSNFTSAFGSSSSLPSTTDDFLTQDMLSICENSSAYASSEDTGLGGETDLMVGNTNDPGEYLFRVSLAIYVIFIKYLINLAQMKSHWLIPAYWKNMIWQMF